MDSGAGACTRLWAPAKVNFGLRVCGLRSDGYHELESLFLPLDHGDVLELGFDETAADEGVAPIDFALEAGGEGVPAGEENLAVRAARAFMARAEIAVGLQLRLRKQLPVGGGLGGGSSDAAAVLLGLAKRFPDALSAEELGDLALGLGADVPFFLDPRPAWVSGIGERITPLEAIPSFALLLVNPGSSLSTPRVFQRFDERGSALTPWESGSTMRAIFEFRRRPRGERLQKLLHNDLEAAARELCAAIGDLSAQLRSLGATAVAMSGSGATVFGVFDTLELAERAREDAALPPGAWARAAQTLASPSS